MNLPPFYPQVANFSDRHFKSGMGPPWVYVLRKPEQCWPKIYVLSSLQGSLEDGVDEALVLGRVGVGQPQEALELRPIAAVRHERGEVVEVTLKFRKELL